jgi:hypothetical protein
MKIDTPELKKPAGEWCANCNPGVGCGIHENRFPVCESFECLWLHSQKSHIDPKLRFLADMRPDKCHVILNKKPDGTMFAHVPSDRPDSWKKGKMGDWLRRESQARPVTVVCGENVFAMSK